MAKWHGYGRCKTRLSKDIGKFNSSKVQKIMTEHTINVAKSLEEQGLLEVSLAITGLGVKRSRLWANQFGIQKFNLQGRGCLGEKMKRQIILNKKLFLHKKIKKIIFIGTDLPDLCHLDLMNSIKELEQNELVFGPASDGGYWLIAFSDKLFLNHTFLPFINISWSKENVLRNTINNFSSMGIRYKFLHKKTDIDTVLDIENRN